MILKDEILVRHAKEHADKTAIVFENKRFTFKELNSRVNSLTQALMDLGVNKGDKIAIMADNCHQYMEIGCAGVKGGMVIVPLYTDLSQRELSYLINNSEANTIIFGENYTDRIDALWSKLESIKNFIVIGKPEENTKSYEELLASYPAKEPQVQVKDNDLYMLACTGGTTGLPKQVMVTYKNVVTTMFNIMYVYNMRHEDIFLIVMPLSWGHLIHWQAFAHLYMGCTIVILKESTPSSILKAMEKEKVTSSLLVASLISTLANYPGVNKYDHSSLRRLVVTGALLPVESWKQAIKVFGNVFSPAYGAAELNAMAFLPPEELIFEGPPGKAKGSSCGKELLSTEIRVVDEQGNDVPRGEVGEVIAKGKHLMPSYWKAPKATEEAIRGGYFYTGDLGMLDEEGYLYLIGRKKDVITSQGKLISPSEVEDIIYRHPSVLEAAVIGVPHEQLGEAVKAFVVLKSGAKASSEEIIELCRNYLPSYAVPSVVDFVASLPKSAVGKILKRELKN
jgi:acyl-CoA synthetase (AMP-forming)/AMP-acid ligase II